MNTKVCLAGAVLLLLGAIVWGTIAADPADARDASGERLALQFGSGPPQSGSRQVQRPFEDRFWAGLSTGSSAPGGTGGVGLCESTPASGFRSR